MTVDELFEEEGYDAVFIATGAGLPRFLGVPGEHLNGEAVDRDLTKRGFSGRGVIDRFAFGVGDPNRRDLTPTVGEKVELLLDMETFRR